MKLSPKATSTYIDCPRHYWFEYVVRPRPRRTGGPWAHLSLGNSVHQAFAEWMVLDPADRTPARAVSLLTARWSAEGYRDDAQVAHWYTLAAEWVEAYAARGDAQRAHVIGNERSIGVRHAGHVFEGRIDRIDRRTGPNGHPRLVVVDYKAGKTAPTQEDADGSFALAIYVLATERALGHAYGRCMSAELHHLPTGTVVVTEYDRDRMHRLLGRLVDLAAEIERARARDDVEAFPARPGPLCASCPFLDSCAPGKARATRADGWAFLPVDAERRDATPAPPIARRKP